MPGSAAARWEWHRLDRAWAARIVSNAGIGPGDLVLDVGAGTGALTAPLLAAGARVVAIELHPGRGDELRRRFGDRDLVVVRADARDLRLPRRPFHVVANPPFGAAPALLRRLVAPGSRLAQASVVVPRRLARRWIGPEAPGAQRWRQTFVASTGIIVPRYAFRPQPPRDAVVLMISRGRDAHRTDEMGRRSDRGGAGPGPPRVGCGNRTFLGALLL